MTSFEKGILIACKTYITVICKSRGLKMFI